DVTVRTDRQLGRLLDVLDQQVGKGKWVLALTADHGVESTAHIAEKLHLDSGYFDEKEVAKRLNDKLVDLLGDDAPKEPVIRNVNVPWVFCVPNFFELDEYVDGKLTLTAVDFLSKQPGVERVFAAADMAGDAPTSIDPDFTMAWRSYFPGRSGVFLVQLAPFWT